MRTGVVIVGVVLAIIGAALLFVPVVPQTSETVQSNSATPFYEGSVAGFSLTGSIPVSVTWTANTTVEMIAAAASCSGTNCANASQISGATIQSGTSGSFTLNQPDGGSIFMGIAPTGGGPANATFKITTALTTVGSVLVIVGILVLIVGAVLKRRTMAMPQAPAQPVQPAAPGTPPTPPPSSGP